MNSLFDRLRSTWDELNDRERRLFLMMAAVLCAFVLGFPLFWTARENAEIESANQELRSTLKLLADKHDELAQLAAARHSATQRYSRRTPPLGTFLEDEAQKLGLGIREVNDQPEKTVGNYRRRSVTASINDTGLTGVVNLLAAISQSPNPVAVESIQVEHYQPGDNYRVKIGVVTFDRQEKKGDESGEKKAAAGEAKSDEG